MNKKCLLASLTLISEWQYNSWWIAFGISSEDEGWKYVLEFEKLADILLQS